MKRAFVIMLAVLMATQAFCGEKERGNKEGRGGRGKGEHGGHHKGGIIQMCLNSERMQEKLQLTEEQIKKLEKISNGIKSRQEKLQAKRKEHGRDQVMAMMDKDPSDIDEKAIMESVNQAGKIQTEMNKLRMKEMIEFNKVLSTEQRKQMREMRQEREKKMKQMREKWEEKKGNRGRDGDEECDKDKKSRREEMRKKWEEKKKRRSRDRDDDVDDDEEEV